MPPLTLFMGCFDNLIGIKGNCGALQVPDSGLFLQDLPNINIAVMDSAIGRDVTSAYDALQRKLELAGILVVNEMRTALSSKFRMSGVVESGKVGYIKDNLQIQSAQAKYVGTNITVDEYPYLEFYITRIGVHLQTSGDVDLKVVDLNSGTVLDTITITAVANTPTYKEVSKHYKTNGNQLNIAVVYDATSEDSYKTSVHPNWCRTCSGSYYNCSYSRIRAVSIGLADVLVDSNLTSLDNTCGVIVEYNLACDLERFACSIKYQLAQCIWYRTGILVLDEIINSKRFNSLITLYQGEYSECRSYYQNYYDTQLKYVLNNLRIPNDVCFLCQPKVMTESVLP